MAVVDQLSRKGFTRPRSRRTLWLVPSISAAWLLIARLRGLYTTPDSALLVGTARNLRCCLSLSSPTDQFWLRITPAAAYLRHGRIPVPDFGPIYPALAAAIPLPLKWAFLLINVTSVVVVLWAVGAIVGRATLNKGEAIASQILVVAGSSSTIGRVQANVVSHPTFLWIAGSVSYDVLAAAFFFVGVALAHNLGSRRRRWIVVALLSASIMTRYLYLGPVIALVVIDRARRKGDRHLARTALYAAGISLTWIVVGYPLISGGATAKTPGWHFVPFSQVAVVVVGWMRLGWIAEHSQVSAVSITVLILVTCSVAAWRYKVPLAAVTVVSVLAVYLGASVLDAVITSSDPRQYLPARIAFYATAAIVVSRMAGRWLRRPTSRHALLWSVVCLLTVGAGVSPGYDPDQRVRAESSYHCQSVRYPGVTEMIREHPEAVVMSTLPADAYSWFCVTTLDVTRPADPSTHRVRNPALELSALSRAMNPRSLLLIIYFPVLLAYSDPAAATCATVVHEVVDDDGLVARLVDISAC